MKMITIAQRLHPFSHAAGTKFLLPKSSFCVQVFPTRLNFSDLEGKVEPFSLSFDFKGPLEGFTAELDLETDALLRVFGKTLHGYMRYLISAKEDGIWMQIEKAPDIEVTGYCSCWKDKSFPYVMGESRKLIAFPLHSRGGSREQEERLSLGMHKSQDWDQLHRRLDLKEIFPYLLRLAALMPLLSAEECAAHEMEGNYALLAACLQKGAQRERETICQAFENLLLAAMEGVLVPRLFDSDYQGIIAGSAQPSTSPLPLLLGAATCARSLFYQESQGVIALLPCLPVPFHCGRMVGIQTRKQHRIDFEWTKKCLRSVLIKPSAPDEVVLKVPKGIRCFRLTCGHRSKVQTVVVDAQSTAVLHRDDSKTVCLDRFEH